GAGVLAATWVLALMTGVLGWRGSFELIGGFTFAVVILSWLAVRDRPQDMGWPPLDRTNGVATNGGGREKKIPLLTGMRMVLTEKYFWPIALWYFFDCGIFFGFGALWGGPYLMHVYDMTRSEAGAILSMIAWGMIVGSPLLSISSDRLLKSRKKTFIVCTGLLTAELLFLCLFPSGLPAALLYPIFLVFSVCASAIVVIGFTTTKELFPLEIAGTSVGMVNFFPFLGGAVYMPLLGRVLDAFPHSTDGAYALEAYSLLLLILLGSAAASLVCTLFMKETYQASHFKTA
ncbi:nitrate/nitrite transporter, partial [Thermodesulfobacteriota bacterium]